jgi:hypothetical protein
MPLPKKIELLKINTILQKWTYCEIQLNKKCSIEFMCVFSRLFGSCREVVVVAVVAAVFPH